MNDHQATKEELLRGMMARSKTRKRVQRRFPVLTFNRQTLQLTAYVGPVVRNPPFIDWAERLRETFPDVRPKQGGAIDFCMQHLEKRQLLSEYCEGRVTIEDAIRGPVYKEYLERRHLDALGEYHSIYSRAVLQRAALERRYL